MLRRSGLPKTREGGALPSFPDGAARMNPFFIVSLLLMGLALVGVFIEIPFISNYAFWVLMGAYLLLAGRK